jgi:dTDP-glucose 4,6-dehydratase/UDP-glucose 4-epimerase
VKIAGRHFLVTGGSGFIGSALVRALVGAGARVRSLDDDSRGSGKRLADLGQAVELVSGDIRDPAAVGAAMRGVDCVCHLAYVNGTEFFYSKPELVLEVAVKGMMNVLDACREHGVRDLVLASSSEVYQTPPAVPTDENVPLAVPDPLNPRYSYGGGKIICELLAVNYGRKFFDRSVIFRPHNVYGPDMGWEHVIPQLTRKIVAAAALAGARAGDGKVVDLTIQGTGEETRAFVFIDDFTDALLRVIEQGEHLGIYHIGTDEEIAIAHLAREIATALGHEVRLHTSPAQVGGTARRCPDITKVRSLGYQPRVPLAHGIARTVPWYATHDRP